MLKRIEDLGYEIQITDKAKEFLAEKGFDADFGARPLQRSLQKFLEEPLAEKVLQGTLKEGDKLKVDYKDGAEGLEIKATKPKAVKSAKSENNSAGDAPIEDVKK